VDIPSSCLIAARRVIRPAGGGTAHCNVPGGTPSVMSNIRPTRPLAASAVLLSLSFAALPAHADVKVHGATTVTFGLMRPQKVKIEQLAGVQLAILPSSTSRGLADLANGKADIAMLAEPLETAAESANKKQPDAIKTQDFVGKHVGNAFVQFIIHPSNPIAKLTKEQLAGLFSGKIKSWSEVGGANVPVLLVGEPTSSPHKMIAEALTMSYAPELRVVQNTNQTAIIVAQAPGALSYITTAHDLPERGKLKVVDSEVKLPIALYLAFRKDASDEVKKVVDAAASVATK
jgi:phosphate transport system substrate-binding protein